MQVCASFFGRPEARGVGVKIRQVERVGRVIRGEKQSIRLALVSTLGSPEPQDEEEADFLEEVILESEKQDPRFRAKVDQALEKRRSDRKREPNSVPK